MSSTHEMKAHEATYGSFITLVKAVIPVLAIITALVIYLIS